jgi:hypothetical protein
MRFSLLLCVLLVLLSACAPEGPTGFVTGSLVPDGECIYSSGGTTFQSVGHYDISPGAEGACDVPYRIHLQLNSYLRENGDRDLGRAEPNILRVHSAEVRLMNLQRQTLAFTDENPPLPNPFLVTTNGILMASEGSEPTKGVAAIEVIPVAYAPYLRQFRNDQIIAEIQVLGTTTGDVDIEMQPFRYPIEICEGCLTVCAGALDPMMLGLEDLEGCQDNAGADGRVCFDPDCLPGAAM